MLAFRYLARGDSIRTKSWDFRLGRSTTYKIIPEVCRAIWIALQPTYLPTLNREDWDRVAAGF